MKRLVLILSIIAFSATLFAQQAAPGRTVFTGAATQNKTVSDTSYSFNLGAAFPYFKVGTSKKLQVGFPYNALYLDQTFAGDLSVSKGYFPDYIKLQWDVTNNASTITHFEIFRKKIGEPDSVWVDNIDATARKWEDYYCEPNDIYSYTLHAIGIPGSKTEYYTFIQGIGFRTPLATVTGQISFSGGNGVKNVVVTASTDDEVPSKSLAISGGSYLEMPQSKTIDFSSGFTFQSYLSLSSSTTDAGIFEKDGNFQFSYKNQHLVFKVGSNSVSLPFIAPPDTFFHVSAVYTGDSALIYIPTKATDSKGNIYDTTLVAAATVGSITPSNNSFKIANSESMTFSGNIDEIRIWSRNLDSLEILRDYNRYINKKEEGLFAMLRLNEGSGTNAYDISQTGSSFNENHCHFVGTQISWSEQVPTINQLGNKGITDSEGNYIISGIPFLAGGSAYKFTPMLAPHEFDPSYKILFLSEDAVVHNNINFTDISSFFVDGTVAYRNTNLGVKDVEILVDGQPVYGNNNTLVKTDAIGNFTVEVPIGAHFISLKKAGHQFDNGGRWPYYEEYPDSIMRHDFNQNVTFGKPFIDTTLITVIGRVIGGTASSQIPMGFEQSENNIGTATIKLTHNSFTDLTFQNDSVALGEENIIYSVATEIDENGDTTFTSILHKMDREEQYTSFYTSAESGEFMAKLIPERFSVVNINVEGDGENEINNFFNTRVMDLSSNPSLKYEYLYDDEGQLLDSIPYHLKFNYMYQTTPEIEVTNIGDTVLFYGEKEITVENIKEGTEETIEVSDHFKFPIFKSFNDYSSVISVFESYHNYEFNTNTRQPVKEAQIKIVNDLAIKDQVKIYELKPEMNGVLIDTFKVGIPNVAKSTSDNTSFTKKMEVHVTVDDYTYLWEPNGDLYRAYIMGQNPKGNNFYTEGPQVPEIILHDPPGSKSYAYIEKGSTYSVSSGFSTKTDNGSGFGVDILLGCTVELGGGLAGPVIKTDSKNSASTGLNFSTTVNESGQYVQSYEFSERVQTSDDPTWVGAMADIYIGKSYNYFYGETDNLKIIPYNLAKDNGLTSLDESDLKDTLYTLGIVEGFIMNPDNSDTYFKYTQAHILNKLLPEIEDRRNGLFLSPKYDSKLPSSDIRYGIAHSYDIDISGTSPIINAYFKNNKNDSTLTYVFYPELTIVYDLNPFNRNDTIYEVDSVRYFNNQIGIWIDAIRLNEAEKAKAIKKDVLEQNISFDGGVGSISRNEVQTISYNKESSRTKNVLWTAKGSVGFGINETGFVATGNLHVDHDLGISAGESFSQTMSYGYILSDGNTGDYYSINVYRRPEDGIYNATDLEETKLELPSRFEFGLLGTGVSLIGGGIAVAAAASYGAGGGIPIVAGASAMAISAGLAYIPYTSFKSTVKEEGDKFEPGDIRVGSFDISSPIFATLGGQTMCPYQGLEHTFFYKESNGDSVVLQKPTLQREKPEINVDPTEVNNVPITDKAYFELKLTNNTESDDDQWYQIRVVERYNPHGATVKVDGLGANNRTFLIPANTTISKRLSIEPSDPNYMQYDSIAIAISSTCQNDPTDFIPDISDTVFISASFQKTCTNVEILEPLDNWVVNNYDKDVMTVRLGSFNLSYDSFESLRFEYKPTSGSIWIPAKYWVNDPELINNDEIYDTLFIDDKTFVSLEWDMKNLKDRGYDLRAVSRCTDGNENVSEIISGILDGQRPQVFGTPQPADGILNIDEDISVKFNEPIEAGLLNNFNFEIKGTLNYFELKHEAYIRFNGTTDYASIPEGISFTDKSFTIEFWVRPDTYADAVILSQGNDPASNLEIGLSGTNKTYFKIGNVTKTASFIFTNVPSTAWQHMAYVFDYENGDIFIYQNDKIILEAQNVSLTYNNSGKIYIGKSAEDGSGHFAGSLHELRMWSKNLSLGDVYANQYVAMSGNEIGLYGYWPIDEAFGELAIDKAATRHMEIFAPWETYPGGSSWDFSENKFLSFYTGYSAIIPEMDYTLEFWFKDNNPTDTVCLFSNQKGDGTEGVNLLDKTLSILASPDGKIWVSSQGNLFEAVVKDYFDDSWHHFALVVRRRGNAISYIDGEAQNEKENSVLGGLEGANMVLGARVWNNLSGSGEDMYFQGKLDEFRLWDLAKTQTQLKMDMNSKLNGDEIGLFVYLPFESFYEDALGVMQQEPTLENLDDDLNSMDAVPNNGNNFTTDAPNMKDVRPVQSIAYDFVTADDEIIINPKSYLLPQLEKNIIEITVEGVEDKYGNSMASPVTWTAYVHRNQVRWEDEERLFNKEIYETLQFISSIKNTGGQQIGFSINNLPPWLTASPASGVINPESSIEITFTINPALNIGEYNEDIILRTENGFDEKLPITVRVYKTPPDWKIDPSLFASSMNMVGKVKIEEVLSTDIFDKVAAFKMDTIQLSPLEIKEVLVGVSNVRYVKDFDSYLVFLTVYGNSGDDGKNLSFRLWDASAGQILDDVLPDDLSFLAEEIIGDTHNPVLFEARDLQRQYIPLNAGWNWVSFNKLSSDRNALDKFFAALEPVNNDQIKTKTGQANFIGGIWEADNLDTISHRLMYQIKTTLKDTIIYSGEKLIPEENPIPLISTGAGWNEISYLPDLAMDVNDALRLYPAEDGNVIKSQFKFSMYDNRVNGWLGNLEIMQPNLGYKIKVSSNESLTYPNTTVFKSIKIPQYTSPPSGWQNDLSQYSGNLSIVAQLDLSSTPELNINNQMVLGGFINEQCHGFGSPVLNSNIGYDPFFLNISNSTPNQIIQFKLYDGLTGNTYFINETKPFTQDVIYGTTQEPLELSIKGIATGLGEFESQNSIRCYPNPFSGKINVEFNGFGNEVNIDVINTTGSLVKTIYNGYPVNGINLAVWDGKNHKGANVSSGIYYVRFVSGNTFSTVKISKTK